ncbi:MAG: MarR family winged helix-turn-helix transcriptional regulator [Bacteriovoracaceae bacterium]
MPARKLIESIPRSIRVLRKLTVSALDGSLTLHQTRVLYLIKEGLGQSQIADSLQVSAAAVCKLMHQLSDKGFITMSPGKDRRERELILTKEGSRVLAAVNKQLEKKINKGLEALSDTEMKDLEKGLVVLDKLMSQIKEG